ncbi:hypothetical protein [Vibrio parahaemolyticus]|uniref:hypothetical protein n=1 Tax=Vibrio parahaemolyticus TaxID=670 RepID=UPI00111D67F6|nr:hypothetical protein [Vibrio parahaemolyticus]EIE1275289.1 hypothetical protein [Vibrio parahaemolyticus]ELA8113152.1 hypothetical protein [Vibrio parahaemolyticus]ELA8166958.1 hypothetical protein [Vibrio parahaemolyticus]TOQ64864.1 hypothetical protein CGG90_23570 [Vibrio parahaemolyticus]
MANNNLTMFDCWGDFRLNPDFTAKYKYNEKLTLHGNPVVNIPKVAKDTRVKNTNIIGYAIANNMAIPQQPQKQEGKIRGKSGELLFLALINGARDMNDIEYDHDGWDFEVEQSGLRVEVKTTAPKGGASGTANLSQGDKPDLYVIFKFNNVGKFINAYLIPVDVMKGRPKKVPSTLKIAQGTWASDFEISLRDLQSFFTYANFLNYFNYGTKSEFLLNWGQCDCHSSSFEVSKLFSASEAWWQRYLRLKACAKYHRKSISWCWCKK